MRPQSEKVKPGFGQQFSFWRMVVPAPAKNCWLSKREQAFLSFFLVCVGHNQNCCRKPRFRLVAQLRRNCGPPHRPRSRRERATQCGPAHRPRSRLVAQLRRNCGPPPAAYSARMAAHAGFRQNPGKGLRRRRTFQLFQGESDGAVVRKRDLRIQPAGQCDQHAQGGGITGVPQRRDDRILRSRQMGAVGQDGHDMLVLADRVQDVGVVISLNPQGLFSCPKRTAGGRRPRSQRKIR